jgi:hypothetical protein
MITHSPLTAVVFMVSKKRDALTMLVLLRLLE